MEQELKTARAGEDDAKHKLMAAKEELKAARKAQADAVRQAVKAMDEAKEAKSQPSTPSKSQPSTPSGTTGALGLCGELPEVRTPSKVANARFMAAEQAAQEAAEALQAAEAEVVKLTQELKATQSAKEELEAVVKLAKGTDAEADSAGAGAADAAQLALLARREEVARGFLSTLLAKQLEAIIRTVFLAWHRTLAPTREGRLCQRVLGAWIGHYHACCQALQRKVLANWANVVRSSPDS